MNIFNETSYTTRPPEMVNKRELPENAEGGKLWWLIKLNCYFLSHFYFPCYTILSSLDFFIDEFKFSLKILKRFHLIWFLRT